jgi:hypothetical protein
VGLAAELASCGAAVVLFCYWKTQPRQIQRWAKARPFHEIKVLGGRFQDFIDSRMPRLGEAVHKARSGAELRLVQD